MKGQVTIFILVMILVLITFSFIYFLVDEATVGQLEGQKNILTESEIIQNRVREGMKSCLDNSLNEGLRLIGQQGGFIYKNQEYKGIKVGQDFYETPEYVEFEDKKYTIRIKKPNYQQKTNSDNFYNGKNPVFFSPPLYPCISLYDKNNQNLIKYAITDDENDNDCGKTFDLNSKIISLSKAINPPPNLCMNNTETCICTRNCEKSIQAMLENFIEEFFPVCIGEVDFGVNVTLNNFEISSLISPNSYEVLLNPVVEIKSYDDVINLDFTNSITSKTTIKLKGILEIATDTINNHEALNASFNFSKEIQENNPTKRYSNLFSRINNPIVNIDTVEVNGKWYHIYSIVLSDEDGNLNGDDFVISFAVENRIPVMENIESTSSSVFEVCGVDPDDEGVTLSIPGLAINDFDVISEDGDCITLSYKGDETKSITVEVIDAQGEKDFDTFLVNNN